MQSDIPNPTAPRRLPILPLRDVVVYPHMVLPLFVGRERSVAALDEAMAGNREILLVAQTQADIDEPTAKDIYDIGTLATILQLASELGADAHEARRALIRESYLTSGRVPDER